MTFRDKQELEWLKIWLNGEAELLRQLTERAGKDIPYVWIASGKNKIPPNSPQARRLNQSGLRLKNGLALP